MSGAHEQLHAVVLVADDSLVIRKLLRRQLEEHGHEIVEAVDGEDALVRLRESQPDVVLLDVEMPGLTGYEVLARMRDDPYLAEIPVVFLTARASTADVVEGLRLGAHDYLRKPFEPSELVARVSAAARVKRLQDELRQRNAELDQISRMDVLTGLPNRRHLQEHLRAESSAARRHGLSLALLMVDVDHFKRVNDTYGHEIGDAVLQAVATRLALACGDDCLVGRWGGEEFLVIAAATDTEGATQLAERIREGVAEREVKLSESVELHITVSVGVVAEVDDIDSLLRSADEALYQAKEAGRNRVAAKSN